MLDGLRGSAAILIVIFHVFNYSFGWDTPLSLMHHAYLAVDFFFGLSGFGVAYDFRAPIVIEEYIIFANNQEAKVVAIERSTYTHVIEEVDGVPEWTASIPSWMDNTSR